MNGRSFGMPGGVIASSMTLRALVPELAEAAEAVWGGWEQDENGFDEVLGAGGICQDIASAMIDAMSAAGIEHAIAVHAAVGENHVFVVALLDDGVYEVDIPPSVYETGSGYVWKKRQDARFGPETVTIDRISGGMDPEEFERAYAD